MKTFKSYGNEVKLPTIKECHELLIRYNTPKHVIKHIEGVSDFAVKLAKKIDANSKNNDGLKVNVDMVKKACLLHDILRVVDFNVFDKGSFIQEVTEKDMKIWKEQIKKFNKNKHGAENHAYAAYEILVGNYPELAECVRNHDYKSIENSKDWKIEDFIVTYADKRVRDNGPIPLKERFNNGHTLFENNLRNLGATEDKIKEFNDTKNRIDKIYFDLEKDLLKLAGVKEL